MTTFFTSDTHFGHANIIEYCNRPFYDVEEMDTEMIERWNSVVSMDDTVYHLGDFTLDNEHRFFRYANSLNGNINIIPGSHDHSWIDKFQFGFRFQRLPPLVSIEFPEIRNGTYPQVIVLCHYSMQTWDRAHFGTWHLFGHSHGTLKGIGLSFDVGVDCHNFTPISLEQVAALMKDKA